MRHLILMVGAVSLMACTATPAPKHVSPVKQSTKRTAKLPQPVEEMEIIFVPSARVERSSDPKAAQSRWLAPTTAKRNSLDERSDEL